MVYKNVQGLRAIAASLVVIAHAGCVMYVPSAAFTLGLSGVDISCTAWVGFGLAWTYMSVVAALYVLAPGLFVALFAVEGLV